MIGVFVLWLLAWQNPTPEALQHLQAGADAEKHRHLEVAIAEYKKAVELAPDSPTPLVSLGQAYLETRAFGDAIPVLKHALELSPELASAHQLLGYALLAQGYTGEAVPHLQHGDDKAALGIAQIESGQLADAVVNLQGALAKRPNDPDLLYYFGRASGLLSKQSMDTLLAAYPDSARAHQALAENYYVLRQMPQAAKEFEEAIRLRPDAPKLHLELGLVYEGSSQWPRAEEEYRKESKLQPGSAEAAFRLGNALLQQGRAREARTELEQSDRLAPEMPETLYALGKAASALGDSKTAETSWNKVLSLEKEGTLAAQSHFALASLYRKQGKTADAEQQMEAYKKLQARAPSAESQPK